MLLLHGPLAAQAGPLRLEVRVVAATGEPVIGAAVRLVDERGEVAVSAITGGGGMATLTGVRAGAYRVEAERFGYRPSASTELVLERPPLGPVTLLLEVEPVSVDALRAATSGRCARPPPALLAQGISRVAQWLGLKSSPPPAGETGNLLLRAHAHAMQALRDVIAARPHDPGYRVLLVTRHPTVMDRGGAASRVDSVTRTLSRLPPAPAAEWLVRHGWMQPRASAAELPAFHMPTPEILTSTSLAESHCFSGRSSPDSAVIGLAFDPAPGDTSFSVRGVIWVDTLARRAVRIEYGHTRLVDFLAEHEFRYAWDEMQNAFASANREGNRLYAHIGPGPRLRPLEIRHRPNAPEADFGGVIHFGSVDARWDVASWNTRAPVLRGGAQYESTVQQRGTFRNRIHTYVNVLTRTTEATVLGTASGG